MKLPEPYVDVMVTFEDENKNTITKRGFYSNLFNNFAIPPSYQRFNGRLLPHGFSGHHIPQNSNKIKSWKPIKDQLTNQTRQHNDNINVTNK